MTENTDLRDSLAVERTRLANERTFLAYIRTALSLVAAAAVLLQFFATDTTYIIVAWVLGGCGIVMLTVGVVRFFRVRTHLNAGVRRE